MSAGQGSRGCAERMQRVYRSYRAWKDERLREAARVRRLRRLERGLDETDLADFLPDEVADAIGDLASSGCEEETAAEL
jgi:hypothetical protein